MNRKYFSKKYRLTTERDEIAKFIENTSWKMGAEKALLNEQLQEARSEIMKLKYNLASCKISDKTKQKVDKLKEELYLAKGEIRDLYRSLDTKKSVVDNIRSELVTTRRIIVDLSGALHKDRSTLTEFRIQIMERMTVAEHAKATVKLLEDRLASTLHDTTIAIDDVSAQVIDLGFEEY